ncbi:MAG: nucleotide exchange factor GrpE [Gammaproteobacteria bacterium]
MSRRPPDDADRGDAVADDNTGDQTELDSTEAEGQDLASELGQLREQLLAAEDRALRVQAEAQNMIRRAERDVENARKFALERFAGALLPVLDNLERALAAMGEPTDTTRPLAEGVQLTLRSFLDVLQKFEVAAVDPAGGPFNPELHQAMAMIEQPDVAPNSVVQVMQKGYSLNGRLLRPAMVVVAKPAPRIDETA